MLQANVMIAITEKFFDYLKLCYGMLPLMKKIATIISMISAISNNRQALIEG